MMLRQTAWRVMLFTVVLASTALAGPLEELKPGEWYEIPDSKMNTVDPCPTHDCDYSGSTAQNSVMGSWGGGAYDVVRDRLIVWGGGHTNYGGNELYVFDLNTLAWSRLTNPSSPAAKDVPYSSDGQPTSRHTYDYVQYVPAIDAFCSFGGSAFYLSGQTGTNNTDCYYFGSKQWVRRADMPSVVGGLIAAFSAVDGASGHVWVHGTGTYSTSAEYDATTDQWVPHGRQFTENTFTYAYTTAAIDPVHRLFITVGGKFSAQWDMSKPGEFSGEPLVTTGDQTVVNADGPGFVYDSVDQVFVGWAGGTDVYTLDPTTWAWSRRVAAATNTVTPTAPAAAGTYGRFAYSPQKNLFVVANSNNENVFVYKLSATLGQPFDAGTVVGPPDAGPPDAGSPGVDAGMPSDAGPVDVPDAGVTTGNDAGVADAGSGLGPGQGRCACGGTGEGGGATLVLGLVFVALGRRRGRSLAH